MVGRIRIEREKGRQTPAVIEDLYGVRLLTATLWIPDGIRPKQVDRRLTGIIRTFRKNSVSRLIIPSDFPYRDRLQCFNEVDGNELYRAIADVLALRWLETHGFNPGRSCVALAGVRLCPELENTANRLCRYVWGICIEVPGLEAELFATELQRDFGIPVMPRGSQSDLTIEFGQTEKQGQLRLWGEQPNLDGLKLGAENVELPEELLVPILKLMWEQGKLRRQNLQVVHEEK